jgi:hypothetical protein
MTARPAQVKAFLTPAGRRLRQPLFGDLFDGTGATIE